MFFAATTPTAFPRFLPRRPPRRPFVSRPDLARGASTPLFHCASRHCAGLFAAMRPREIRDRAPRTFSAPPFARTRVPNRSSPSRAPSRSTLLARTLRLCARKFASVSFRRRVRTVAFARKDGGRGALGERARRGAERAGEGVTAKGGCNRGRRRGGARGAFVAEGDGGRTGEPVRGGLDGRPEKGAGGDIKRRRKKRVSDAGRGAMKCAGSGVGARRL